MLWFHRLVDIWNGYRVVLEELNKRSCVEVSSLDHFNPYSSFDVKTSIQNPINPFQLLFHTPNYKGCWGCMFINLVFADLQGKLVIRPTNTYLMVRWTKCCPTCRGEPPRIKASSRNWTKKRSCCARNCGGDWKPVPYSISRKASTCLCKIPVCIY